MVVAIFGSWIIGAILLFLAQKIQSKLGEWAVRIIGILFFIWPILMGVWNNYISP
jgi:hypothetical protein